MRGRGETSAVWRTTGTETDCEVLAARWEGRVVGRMAP